MDLTDIWKNPWFITPSTTSIPVSTYIYMYRYDPVDDDVRVVACAVQLLWSFNVTRHIRGRVWEKWPQNPLDIHFVKGHTIYKITLLQLFWVHDTIQFNSIFSLKPLYGTWGAIYNMYKYVQYTWYTWVVTDYGGHTFSYILDIKMHKLVRTL